MLKIEHSRSILRFGVSILHKMFVGTHRETTILAFLIQFFFVL